MKLKLLYFQNYNIFYEYLQIDILLLIKFFNQQKNNPKLNILRHKTLYRYRVILKSSNETRHYQNQLLILRNNFITIDNLKLSNLPHH